MRKLDFRVSYNTTLFNFVDILSRWDYFVAKHIRKYFVSNYGIDAKDEEVLAKYSAIRKKLDWPKEIELFDWAYAGFPNHPEFSALEETLRYFEHKNSKAGSALNLELQNATKLIAPLMKDIADLFKEVNIESTIAKFSSLFEVVEKEGIIPAYLAYTPTESSQAGANGEGIYTQVSITLEGNTRLKQAVDVLSHEYMHKELNPGLYFKNHPDKTKRQIYNSKVTEVYPDSYFDFVEEVIVYTINDVITFGANPEKKREHYSGLYKDDPVRQKHFVSLWQGVCDVKPMLEAFRDGKKDKETIIAALDEYFIGLIR